jgi:succinate dehydrogenase / fumarate reductase cytochrome b subunit
MSSVPIQPVITSASSVKPLEATVAKKALVAITGIVLYGFVLVHMVGNFQLYQGPEKLNHYAELLQSMKPVLWTFRIVLLAAVGIHALMAIQLWLRNRAARPVSYASQRFVAGTITSRTMIWSGPLIGFFVVYHILHFTVGSVHPHFDKHDVYSNVVLGFQQPGAALAYIIAMVALGFHLYHGSVSLFQTLGLRTPTYEKAIQLVFGVVTTLIVAVNISFPIAVLTGIVGLK